MRSETKTQQWFLDDPRTRRWIVQCGACGLYGRRSDTPASVPKVNFEAMFPVMALDDQGLCANCGDALRPPADEKSE